MDEQLNVIYINEELDRADWHTFEVGKTRFTDEALRQAGQFVSMLPCHTGLNFCPTYRRDGDTQHEGQTPCVQRD